MAIDPTNDPYVLLGRVVTMGQNPPPNGVIDQGAVYIRAGSIVDVLDERAPSPAGFESAERVKTGGTIYPGLIELHNHLSYNAIPLWQVPRAYMHSGHWQGTDEYRVNVTKPAMVLANTAGNAEALVRFAECRCLLGGVTSSQGVTLQANSGVRSLYAGLVRNVESSDVPGLRAAKCRIGEPDKDLDKYLNKLVSAPDCYLQHLSEGINDGVHDTAIKQFTGLQRPDGTWALFKSLCGVHSTALKPEHFQILGSHGGSIVWSPLSNYLLYGQTTDVKSAKAAGVPIALGSDWAPSGTKNLLGELKVAALVSEELGDLFTPRELCEMVTTTPAEILGWDQKLGRLEAGMLADLIVVDDMTGEPFKKLIEARETSLTFVVIGGIPRVGQARLMGRFTSPGLEEIKVGSSKRLLDLTTQPGDVDLGVSLTAATAKLADTLQNLPERASDLDNAIAAGWTPGVELAAMGLSEDLMPPGWTEPQHRVVLEFEEEDNEDAFLAALRAGDLADWVQPMELDGITVPDDPTFLKRLMYARNLPRFVKEKLPPMHGAELEVPDDSVVFGAVDDSLVDPMTSRTLREFLEERPRLSDDERRRIIDQGILLLERYYVHLPMKRTMHAVDPIQRLRNLNHEFQQGRPGRPSDLDFHREVISVFDSLRDLHTCYRLPQPFRGKVAWLPYLIEECADEDGSRRFIVSKIVGAPVAGDFDVGAQVLHWNGVQIDRYVQALARDMPGGNAAARRARAMNSLTLRSLTRGQIPNEDWVSLRYKIKGGKVREHRQPWLLFSPPMGYRSLSPENFGYIE
ncbi:MAG TPA: amidohydrolase family protein, partial [Rhodothermales bacterium]